MDYSSLTEAQQKKIIKELYVDQHKSFQDIASLHNTYANKVRRDAKKFNIHIRDKSEAQKNALATGKHKHPTKGTQRTEETKSKIGAGVINFWDGLDESEIQKRKDLAKKNWDSLSEDQKAMIQKEANNAVRLASKTGSKLEKFLLSELTKDGFRVDFHKEQALSNTKLQIDLFLPKLNIAIEVDGPSHFLPVWGEDTLKKNIAYDNKKTGLILGKGLVLIRVKQIKEFSKSRSLMLYKELKQQLDIIVDSFPEKDKRYIEIGD